MVVVCEAVWGQTQTINNGSFTSNYTSGSWRQGFNIQENGLTYGRIELDPSNNLIISNMQNKSVTFRTNASERLTILNNGKVGIGTIEPSEKLVVNGNIMSSQYIFSQSGTKTPRIYVRGLGSNNMNTMVDIRAIRDGDASILYDVVNGDLVGVDYWATKAVRSDNSFRIGFGANDHHLSISKEGKVGIGTSNPYSKLTVAQTTYENGFSIHDPVGRKMHLYGSGASGRQILATEGTINPFCIDLNGTERFRIESNGEVGIGTTSPSAKLDVAGDIKAHEIEVTLASINDMQLNGTLAANNITYTANGNTADFVFEDSYQLKDLSEVEAFIKTNKHLPEIPSAAKMEEAGVNLAEMNKLLLMKVEELTLYAIEQEKKIEKMTEDRRRETEEMKERLAKMEALLNELE